MPATAIGACSYRGIANRPADSSIAGNGDLIMAAMSRLVMFAAMNAIKQGSCRQRRYQRR
jgi:hypothetical protein